MLKRALTLSLISISALLIVQIIWLFLLVRQEKENFKVEYISCFKKAIASELRLRRNTPATNNKLDIVEVNKRDYDKQKLYPGYKRYVVDSKDVGENDLFMLTVEHVYQSILRKSNPIKLNVLSRIIDQKLDSLSYRTVYTFTYHDSDTTRLYSNNKVGKLEKLLSFFYYTEYLSATKDMKITSKVYYPISVFKGEFLLISFVSIAIFILIVFTLSVQLKQFSNQITLSKLKENLTRFFTHELRSPLQSALSGVEMLEEAAKNGKIELVERYGKVSKDKIRHINGFVERMLDINKLNNSRVKLNKERFNLSLIVNKLADEYSDYAAKKINLRIDNSCDIEIFANYDHIHNALSNLVENAVKYSGDSVSIKISAQKDDKKTTITVEDNGIGIPEVDQKMIFNQFYRVNNPLHATKSKGFGLGLNYVKWVALVHSGNAFVESKEGIGSKFSFTIRNI